jgi:hypothetical protein
MTVADPQDLHDFSVLSLTLHHERSYTFSLEQDQRSKEAVSFGPMAIQVPLIEIVNKATYLIFLDICDRKCHYCRQYLYHRKQVAFDRGGE